MKGLWGLVLLMLATGLLPAEPPRQGRELTAEEQKEVARLDAEGGRHLAAGRFEDLVRTAKREVDYRTQRQGANHWQVIDARLSGERWQRLTSVAEKDRPEVVRALLTAVEGMRLQRRLRYPEAEAKLREALALCQKILGEQHPDTGTSYDNLAACLNDQRKYAEALPLARKARAIFLKALGEQHASTASTFTNLAICLNHQGQRAEALLLLQKALAINRKVLGEQHPLTAQNYNNLAFFLNSQGKYVEAAPLFQGALAICQKVLGEQHPHTASSYNNLAACLSSQGQHAEALPLLRKALDICRKVLGEQHPDTAFSYNNLATCLHRQGRPAEALPLYRKALAIQIEARGEQHPDTGNFYNNVALCLHSQGRYAEALLLLRKALAIYLKVRGEQHSDTANSYNNLAFCLNGQGQHVEALSLARKALAIHRKVLGEQHPLTAHSYNGVAFCLERQGKHAEALPLYEKALAIRLKVLGEQHPDTANSYNNLAFCLYDQGKHAEAARTWEKALLGSEWGRLQASSTGFDRSLYNFGLLSPHAALATCLVRLGKPLEAWQQAEADLARGLLDDLLPSTQTRDEASRRARVRQLDQALLPLLALDKADAEQVKRRDALTRERDVLLTALATDAARRLRERLYPLPRVQKQLEADTALVCWLDVRGAHLGCVLRNQGPPHWVRLPGSDKEHAWTNDDWSLAARVGEGLANSRLDAEARQRLLGQLHRQRIAPLVPHLKGVRQLLVVPVGLMATVPIEALTEGYTVSYVPSASVFARQAEQHRPLQAASLLVLADPVFTRTAPVLPVSPKDGLLILALAPRSLAARIGLRPGDVLLEYNGKKLSTPDDLTSPEGNDRVSLKLWREGKTLAGRIPAGKLGVIVDKRPVAEALAAWRKQETDLLALERGDWQPLPGTRLEARALAALVPRSTVLLGSEANQQRLAELAAADKLRDFRLLHLATHGRANAAQPRLSALILAQDHLDDAAAQARAVLAGKQPVDGRLTVADVLADWRLDADLVVLSACQTGLGTNTGGGEGMLGFTQALLLKGARSVVLSRWKVDDAATALLMTRFYENLLGKRQGTKPLGRAAALAEAKVWLRGLSRVEATKHLVALVDGVPRGERGSIKAALPTRKPDAPKGDDRPFAAPYYWAAFVLVGDPN